MSKKRPRLSVAEQKAQIQRQFWSWFGGSVGVVVLALVTYIFFTGHYPQ